MHRHFKKYDAGSVTSQRGWAGVVRPSLADTDGQAENVGMDASGFRFEGRGYVVGWPLRAAVEPVRGTGIRNEEQEL